MFTGEDRRLLPQESCLLFLFSRWRLSFSFSLSPSFPRPRCIIVDNFQWLTLLAMNTYDRKKGSIQGRWKNGTGTKR